MPQKCTKFGFALFVFFATKVCVVCIFCDTIARILWFSHSSFSVAAVATHEQFKELNLQHSREVFIYFGKTKTLICIIQYIQRDIYFNKITYFGFFCSSFSTFSAGYWSPQSWRRSWRRLARSDQFCHAGGQTLAAGLREGLDRLKFEQQIWSAAENLFNFWATERALVLRSLDDLRSGCKKDRFFMKTSPKGRWLAKYLLEMFNHSLLNISERITGSMMENFITKRFSIIWNPQYIKEERWIFKPQMIWMFGNSSNNGAELACFEPISLVFFSWWNPMYINVQLQKCTNSVQNLYISVK